MGVLQVLNVLGMSLDFHNIEESGAFYYIYKDSMLFFTYFYYCECIIKLTALGCAYFQDGWCRLGVFLARAYPRVHVRPPRVRAASSHVLGVHAWHAREGAASTSSSW